MGSAHSLAEDHNRGKFDDVRSQLGDEYEEIFDSGSFHLSCDTE